MTAAAAEAAAAATGQCKAAEAAGKQACWDTAAASQPLSLRQPLTQIRLALRALQAAVFAVAPSSVGAALEPRCQLQQRTRAGTGQRGRAS